MVTRYHNRNHVAWYGIAWYRILRHGALPYRNEAYRRVFCGVLSFGMVSCGVSRCIASSYRDLVFVPENDTDSPLTHHHVTPIITHPLAVYIYTSRGFPLIGCVFLSGKRWDDPSFFSPKWSPRPPDLPGPKEGYFAWLRALYRISDEVRYEERGLARVSYIAWMRVESGVPRGLYYFVPAWLTPV